LSKPFWTFGRPPFSWNCFVWPISCGTERHVRKAEHYINEQYGKIDSLRQVAEAIGIGYDHLRHSFKARRGKSLVRQLNEVRVERAKALLAHSRLPLKQISSMCGFRDEYYFSAVFRKLAHAAPGRYRENIIHPN
jgi:transcriptional regulator GlxA family with amidase domain